MDTIDDILTDAMQGIDLARRGLDIVRTFVPALELPELGLTALYEALVIVRSMRAHATDEDIRAAIIAKMQAAMQELAAAKFGARDPSIADEPTGH